MADINVQNDQADDTALDEAATPTTSTLTAPTRHHAVWVMSLNMGSCNGCDQQIMAMLAPRYQLARRGISFATSPRHADIILLTGTLTQRSRDPIQRVLEQVPDPRALIAVGDCVINGSVFAGSPAIVPNAADFLGVNIEIAGNPPAPAEIILAIEKAAALLDEANGDTSANEVEADSESEDEISDEEAEMEEEDS